jgi:cytochrome P450
MTVITPPMPPCARENISGIDILRAFRRNAFEALPRSFLDEPVVRRAMPIRSLFVATSADAVRDIMIDHHEAFVKIPAVKRVLGPLIGNGLLASEGDAWKRQRHAMAPAFSPKQVDRLIVHIAPAADSALNRLETQSASPLQLLDFMQALSLDIAATAMFSTNVSEIGPAFGRLLNEYLHDLGKPSVGDFLFPWWLPTSKSLQRAVFRRRWLDFILPVVANRRREGSSNRHSPDLFDLLSSAHGEGQDDLIADEVTTMLLAGHETTALTLFWACTLLAQAPDLQNRLAEEALAADWPDQRNPACLPSLPFATAVVQETLRLYSPAHMSVRLAKRSQSVSNVSVSKGSMVVAPYWLIHRNPRLWRAPDSFSPDRFLNKPVDRFSFLPFGIGPHVCIGARLAMLESTYIIAKLLRNFELALTSTRPILPIATITTRPNHSPYFHIRPRKGT